MEAPSLDSDIHFLKKKIKNGAEYIVTQMFFDNQKYFEYVEHCRQAGINVPIIPGLKPITTKKHLSILPHYFYTNLPDELVDNVEKATDNREVREAGIDWCICQSKELKEAGVPVLHYYSMGRSKVVSEIAKAVF
jgi:methylenetetrahydrofolate reductase (NADPH)